MTSRDTYTMAKSKTMIVKSVNDFHDTINRMRTTLLGIDVTLVCDDMVEISAHQFILSGYSLFFKNSFQSKQFLENKSDRLGILRIYDMDSITLEAIINYCYIGQLKISIINVKQLLIASYALKMEHVTEHCLQFIYSYIDISNCNIFLDIGRSIDCPDMINKIKNFIEINFREFSQEKTYLKLTKDELFFMIKHCKLCVPNETYLFDCLMKWINYQLTDRSKYCIELLKLLNYSLISEEYYNETMINHPVVVESDCIDFFTTNTYSELKSEPDEKIDKTRYYMNNVAVVFRNLKKKKLSMLCYEFDSSSWFVHTDLPRNREGHMALTLNDMVFVLGGKMTSHRCTAITNTVDVFDLFKETWTIGTPMLLKRFDFHAGVINNKIYVVGGRTGIIDVDLPAIGEMFDPVLNKWTLIPELEYYTHTNRIVFYNEKIYIFGHIYSSLPLICVTRIFDPKTKEWSELVIPNNIANKVLLTDIVTIRNHEARLFDPRGAAEMYRYNFNDNKWYISYMIDDNPKLALNTNTVNFVTSFDDKTYIRFGTDHDTELPSRLVINSKVPIPSTLCINQNTE